MGDREVDQQLVERAQRGDKHAFELLVAKYQRRLSRLISRFVRDQAEVEDVTQEAFIKAYRALPAFRGESAFYTWLYRIGINTAKNYLLSMGRRAPTSTRRGCWPGVTPGSTTSTTAGRSAGSTTSASPCCAGRAA